jgi:hypothetical protein
VTCAEPLLAVRSACGVELALSQTERIMAANKKSQQPSSKPASGRPASDRASSESSAKAESSAKTAPNPHAIDPGTAKLYSPAGPLMWLLVPFLLCILIMILKR